MKPAKRQRNTTYAISKLIQSQVHSVSCYMYETGKKKLEMKRKNHRVYETCTTCWNEERGGWHKWIVGASLKIISIEQFPFLQVNWTCRSYSQQVHIDIWVKLSQTACLDYDSLLCNLLLYFPISIHFPLSVDCSD